MREPVVEEDPGTRYESGKGKEKDNQDCEVLVKGRPALFPYQVKEIASECKYQQDECSCQDNPAGKTPPGVRWPLRIIYIPYRKIMPAISCVVFFTMTVIPFIFCPVYSVSIVSLKCMFLSEPVFSNQPQLIQSASHPFLPFILSIVSTPITAVTRTVASPRVSYPLKSKTTPVTRLTLPVLSTAPFIYASAILTV